MNTASVQSPRDEPVENPLATLQPRPKPRQYTLEQYLRREERARERHEYFNGYIKPVPMAKGPHNIITLNIGSALKVALKAVLQRYIVFSSNQKVYIPQLNIGLYPDALVVSEQPEYHDEGEILLVNPLLIVEVLSKSTAAFDRGDKFRYYKSLPSFQEYVLIEQTECAVETYFREAPDLWRTAEVKDPSGVLPLRSIGCSIQMADIYENISFDKPRKKGEGKS